MKIEVSNGEIVDKYTILKIKLKNSTPFSQKYFNILEEYNVLKEVLEKIKIDNDSVQELYEINKQLWDIEDKIRVFEKEKKFNEDFIELARSVYIINDKRFQLKNKINNLTDSQIKEEKILPNYN